MKIYKIVMIIGLYSLPILASAEDRAIGSLMGLAVGDAMGISQEMIPRLANDEEEMHKLVLKARRLRAEIKKPQKKMEGGGPFMPNIKLKPGEFSDDTSQALCLADCLIANQRLDPTDLMRRFLRWDSEGYNSSIDRAFGVGTNTSAALTRFKRDQSNPFVGGTDETSNAGNGSIMRLSPVAIFWSKDQNMAIEMAKVQSSVTHNVSEALEASAFLAEILVRAINGEAKRDLFVSKQKFSNPSIAQLAAQNPLWQKKEMAEIRSLPGRASLSLEAALWAVYKTESFQDAILLAVSLAGDADTIGAITGQIAGALYGEKAIPTEWIKTLAFHDKIRLKANALFHHLPDSPDFALRAGQ